MLAVSALITSLAVWRGEDPAPTGSASRATSPTTAVATPPSTGTASPSPTTTGPAVGTASPTDATTVGGTGATVASPVRRTAVVAVLNQTVRSGLAATVASLLRGKGWSVPVIGNFRGTVPATTVYYPDGMAAQARAAAADLPVPSRVLPVFPGLSTAHLTVVVTASYPG